MSESCGCSALLIDEQCAIVLNPQGSAPPAQAAWALLLWRWAARGAPPEVPAVVSIGRVDWQPLARWRAVVAVPGGMRVVSCHGQRTDAIVALWKARHDTLAVLRHAPQ